MADAPAADEAADKKLGATGGAAAATAAAPAAGAVDRESASRTFFTTIDAEPAPKTKHRDSAKERHRYRNLESTSAGPRIADHHADLTNLAETLDQRMGALLREHEKDFFLAYKTHMYTVQKEIKTLRMKADHEEAKTREDTKIKALEGELDWFMTEALRLDELCKGYKKEVDKWKAKAEALDEDRRFLEDQIKGAKRQNKILRAAAERARSSAYSALMVTRAKADANEQGGQAVAELLAVGNGGYPSDKGRNRPASAGPAAGSGARGAQAARSRTPDAQMQLAVPGSGAVAAMPGRGPPAALASSAHMSATSLSTVPALEAGPMSRSVLGSEAEERYVEAIQHLKESIVREQHNVRMLQASRATSYSSKSEMEEFFLKCIDEARKELMRKRHMTMYKEKSERERVLEAMLNNEDVLVCLYEKLFPHRTGIARSLGGPVGGGPDDGGMMALED